MRFRFMSVDDENKQSYVWRFFCRRQKAEGRGFCVWKSALLWDWAFKRHTLPSSLTLYGFWTLKSVNCIYMSKINYYDNVIGASKSQYSRWNTATNGKKTKETLEYLLQFESKNRLATASILEFCSIKGYFS